MNLPENKRITKLMTLEEIRRGIEGKEHEQKPAEMLLQHLSIHANRMAEEIRATNQKNGIVSL